MEQRQIVARPFWAVRGHPPAEQDAPPAGLAPGTVAGSVHMDLCAALLVEEYGKRWFEDGCLALTFHHAATVGDRVQAACEEPSNLGQVRIWVRREDGLEVASGSASVADHHGSALRNVDLRPVAPADLRILAGLRTDRPLARTRLRIAAAAQRARLEQGAIGDPLGWYAADSPWSGPIATVSSTVEMLHAPTARALAAKLGDAVGLFGAIELVFRGGPLRLGERYRVESKVVAFSESPRTEMLWIDADAREGDRVVASQRTMLRFMKASSAHYPPQPSPGAGGAGETGADPAN